MNTTQVQKIYELLKQRKRYSDNYYKTIMRDYLMDDSISVQSKIEYMLPFGEAGDDSLVNYGVGYLDSISKQKNLSRVERELIRTLKNNTSAQVHLAPIPNMGSTMISSMAIIIIVKRMKEGTIRLLA